MVARLVGRLDATASVVSQRPDAVALLGLGSAGAERERMDEYSDLDFFLVVELGARAAYLHDIDWPRAAAPVAFDVRNSADGRKVLFADGIYAE